MTLAHAPEVAPPAMPPVDRRVLFISAVSIGVGVCMGVVARLLTVLITVITNAAFFHRLSLDPVSPALNTLGMAVVLVPVAGALVIGMMARYGTPAIRGHGIPEAMERVLFHQSRIPGRVAWLKPLSAALSIGTGGPFGAEGPIIATGAALGSLVGQRIAMSDDERKTLLAAGAGAGMAATFGAPVSAVLLAIELLLFEYRPRSIIPVALATSAAAAARIALFGSAPAFAMPDVAQPLPSAIAVYVGIGALAGVASVFVTAAVYAVEDAFERLSIHGLALHWMWWPALGAVVVGVVGYVDPRTLGVGYDNIEALLGGDLLGMAALVFCLLKFTSWVIALGSGTSGGTLAPLFTIGGGLGVVLGSVVATAAPGLGVDVRVAALVGMAAMFAGASRALLASVVFAFEATRQPLGLLPLLAGCSAAWLVAGLLARESIMTEKIARRGLRVPSEYLVDALSRVLVRDVVIGPAQTLHADDAVDATIAWLASGGPGSSHQGYPVVDEHGTLVGVVTLRDLRAGRSTDRIGDRIRRPPAVVAESATLREAADHMRELGIGRLAVVRHGAPSTVVGMLTRSDVLGACSA